ncbi:related to RTM1 protein [Phialocephala subalpina]|uniref:Related to RTM1 protein n=1 Tax=Phialocephala subalpina TaxID=576137 RepID=A0A1L7WVZ1_9HELO|nr:related to RTM1 protein [Phialocephala subalpina]
MSDSTIKEAFVLYHYNPSKAAAVIFILLFLGTSLYHAFQLFRNKTWYFIPFLIGGFFETLGYCGRAKSASESPDWTLGPYIMQSLLTLLGPTLFAASIYMILGRIIRLTDGEECSIIRAKWLTKVFVMGDVLSFLAQSAGGGMLAQAKSADDQKRGTNTITGGLGIQVVFFGIFIVVAGIFHMRITKNPTVKSMSIPVPWQRYLLILYVASTFIMIRSIFRIAEYVQGQDGALLKTEVYLYIFDATLMFLTMVIFNIFHPSAIINKETLSKGEWAGQSSAQSYGV